jgi:hypothetical protein
VLQEFNLMELWWLQTVSVVAVAALILKEILREMADLVL